MEASQSDTLVTSHQSQSSHK